MRKVASTASTFEEPNEREEELLDVVKQTRLVGLIISDDLKWKANTESLVKKAYAKIWILRRLKTLGASRNTLRLIYFQNIRRG